MNQDNQYDFVNTVPLGGIVPFLQSQQLCWLTPLQIERLVTAYERYVAAIEVIAQKTNG